MMRMRNPVAPPFAGRVRVGVFPGDAGALLTGTVRRR